MNREVLKIDKNCWGLVNLNLWGLGGGSSYSGDDIRDSIQKGRVYGAQIYTRKELRSRKISIVKKLLTWKKRRIEYIEQVCVVSCCNFASVPL